ncbi:MAG: hypothetical protein DRN17_07205 [Thermoplasmata archaeon]|nr:MAG: hypothetical protein DRN17_07205 [Thermoplasmata archaeon]
MTAAYLADALLLQTKKLSHNVDVTLKLPVGKKYYFINSLLKGQLTLQYVFTTDLIKGLYIDTLKTSMTPVCEVKTGLSKCLEICPS